MKACQSKYETLMGYRTWDLVPKPFKTNIVGSQWTFRVKCDNLSNINKFKARVVAQGFSQVPGVNFTETYSPTIRLTSIRFILAYACQNDLELKQVDIKGAYLNGWLDDDDIYMHQPDGFIIEGKEDLICKLNKSMYGLKQSGRVWSSPKLSPSDLVALPSLTKDLAHLPTMHDIDPNLLHPSLLSRSRDASEAKLKDVLKCNNLMLSYPSDISPHKPPSSDSGEHIVMSRRPPGQQLSH